MIADQSTETVKAAIQVISSGMFVGDKAPESSEISVEILNTDSHKALIRLAAKMCLDHASEHKKLYPTKLDMNSESAVLVRMRIDARCMMHMFFAAISRPSTGHWALRCPYP